MGLEERWFMVKIGSCSMLSRVSSKMEWKMASPETLTLKVISKSDSGNHLTNFPCPTVNGAG